MNLKKLFLSCLMICMGVLLAAQSYVLQDSDLTVDTNGIITDCSYDFTNNDIIIPDSVNGTEITGIADVNVFGTVDIFYAQGISNVVLPSGIKTIGDNAFKGNDLTSVALPDGLLRIGESAFNNNDFAFTEIDIPNSVTFIGQYAFSMNAIDSIKLPVVSVPGFEGWIDNNGTEYEGGTTIEYNGNEYRAIINYTLQDDDVEVNEEGMISSCSYDFTYTDIIIPDTLDGVSIAGIEDKGFTGIFEYKGITSLQLPNTITYVGNNAFRSNELLSINIPGAVKYIGVNAFSSNNMDSVDIPNSVTYIGQQAFWGIDSIVLPTPNEFGFEYWISSNGNNYPGGEKVEPSYDWFEAKIIYTLTDADVQIHNGNIDTCMYDFSRKYIKIPDSLHNQRITGISNGKELTFYNYEGVFSHKGIKEVQLPNYIDSIGDYAFYENELDRLMILPDHIKYIGIDAFTLNSSFNGVVLPAPTNGSLICKNWIDNNNNVYEIGDTITNFYEKSYTAQFTYPPGTSFISLSDPLNFENVTVNTQSSKALTITNEGNTPFTVTNIVLPDGYTADWTNGEISNDSSQVVNITFSPIQEITYSGMIQVISNATDGIDSVSVSGTGENSTSTQDISISEKPSIYPNPASSYIILPVEFQNTEIEIFTLSGTLILRQELTDNRINIEDLKNGMYIVKIINNKINMQTEFIKQ